MRYSLYGDVMLTASYPCHVRPERVEAHRVHVDDREPRGAARDRRRHLEVGTQQTGDDAEHEEQDRRVGEGLHGAAL